MSRMIDSLYAAFAEAETGGESNPWIRTKVIPDAGSTAYGPVQITRTLAEQYLKNKKDLFDKEELDFLKRFIKQGQLFAKFGREPNKQGYDPIYDYGGEGILTSPEDKQLYESMAKKMLLDHYSRNGGDLEKTIKEWRYGAASKKGFKDDPRYFTKVTSAFGQQKPEELERPKRKPKVSEDGQTQEASENAYDSLVDSLMQELNSLSTPPQRQRETPSEPQSDPIDELTKLVEEDMSQEQIISRGERRLAQTYKQVTSPRKKEFSEEDEKKIQELMNMEGETVVLRETTNPTPVGKREPEEREDDPSKDPIYGLF